MKSLYERLSNQWTNDSIRLINTASAFARNSLFYIQEIGTFSVLDGYYAERENLSSYLILLTTKGSGVLSYQNKTYKLGRNDIFWIDCNKHHSYEIDSNEWEFIWLHFNGNSSYDYYQIFRNSNEAVINVSEDIAKSLCNIHKSLISLCANTSIKNELLISSLVCQFLTKAIENSLYIDYTQQLSSNNSMASIAKYLEEHFLENISLDDLANNFYLSKYYISREFKKCMGLGLWDYLTGLRVNYAKEELKDSNKTISEIAIDCGIPNVSHFINTFKEKEGITPLAYRKLWK